MRLANWIGRAGWVGAGVGLVLAVGSAQAQGSCTFVDESGKTVTWPNCQDPNAVPPAAPKSGTTPAPAAPTPGTSPAKSFPYPGDQTAPATTAPAGSAPGATPVAPAGSSNSSAPGGNKFPYPGDPANDAAAGGDAKPAGDGLNDAGSSGSSSSSSSSSGDSGSGDDAGPLGGDDDAAAKAAEARRAEKKRLGTAKPMTADEREVEDLRVAAFYQNDGNFKGAYDRAVDAVSIAADDADAHLALADAARRLGKLDEAEKHYRACLKLDPVPKTKRAAEKALKEMSGT